MDYKNILRQSLEINIKYTKAINSKSIDINKFKQELKMEYAFFEINNPAIFNISLSPSYNFDRLKKMLILANKVKTDQLSEHDASVQVGQILVDEVVKPQLNKKA